MLVITFKNGCTWHCRSIMFDDEAGTIFMSYEYHTDHFGGWWIYRLSEIESITGTGLSK